MKHKLRSALPFLDAANHHFEGLIDPHTGQIQSGDRSTKSGSKPRS